MPSVAVARVWLYEGCRIVYYVTKGHAAWELRGRVGLGQRPAGVRERLARDVGPMSGATGHAGAVGGSKEAAGVPAGDGCAHAELAWRLNVGEGS